MIDLKNFKRSDLRYTLGRMRRGTEATMPEDIAHLVEPLRALAKAAGLDVMEQGLKANGGKWTLGIDAPKDMLAEQEFSSTTDCQWYLWGIPRDVPVVFPSLSKADGLRLLRAAGTRKDGSPLGDDDASGGINFTLEDCQIIAPGAATRRSWV